VFAATMDLIAAMDMTTSPADDGSVCGPDEALVGRHVAENLAIGPLAASPMITIDGMAYSVAGVIEDGGRLPELTGAVVVSTRAGQLGAAAETSAVLLTTPSAAQQVAGQAALAYDPVDPSRVAVSAPADPSTLRASIQSDLHTTLMVLTGVALLASVVGLANAMMLAILERRREFGLRRAVGARTRHVVGLVIGESTLIGALGGAVGLTLGLLAVLAVTVVQRWAPVFDLRLAPAAVAGGILVGGLGGVVAAARASRIQPSDALRE